ncbi:CotH kinase family protein [Fibrobacter sp.]|uniref:CotH kinase family protein n=1 Tax=Fibrobacter sp. TaxID=35828 RepID=UPI00388F891A
MTFKREGKLKFGPFWDYDLAFGNSLWTPYANELDRIWMLKLPWFKRFMKDPEFKKKVAERAHGKSQTEIRPLGTELGFKN